MVIPPRIGNVSCVKQESAPGFLMTKVEEPRTFLVRVGLKVEKKVDLVGSELWPFFEFVKDIECGQHSISIWGDLKGGNSKVIFHPLKERVKRQGGTCLNVKLRPGTVGPTWQVGPLVDRRSDQGHPVSLYLFK